LVNPEQWEELKQRNQVEYWNDETVAATLRARQSGVTEFAYEVQDRIAPHSRILELGCGAGDDAAFFASNEHEVVATDVSVPLLDIAAQRFADIKNLEFRHADISQPLNVGGQSCDVVYARFSLHYFDDDTTMTLFSEIAWVLRPGGQLFSCKSTNDPLYGKGTLLGPDRFELDGHARHFFSPQYAQELLEANSFHQIQIAEEAQKLYGDPSRFVKCSAIR
jgi:ubiquinone/menaquinone biosynthesis C-methylase UbiE